MSRTFRQSWTRLESGAEYPYGFALSARATSLMGLKIEAPSITNVCTGNPAAVKPKDDLFVDMIEVAGSCNNGNCCDNLLAEG